MDISELEDGQEETVQREDFKKDIDVKEKSTENIKSSPKSPHRKKMRRE